MSYERKPDGGLDGWIDMLEAMGEGPSDAELLCLLIELRRRRAMRGRTLPRHEFSQMVNELRDCPAVQSKREKIVSILHAFNINPEKPE